MVSITGAKGNGDFIQHYRDDKPYSIINVRHLTLKTREGSPVVKGRVFPDIVVVEIAHGFI